jgi:hypothetical protein
MAVRLVAQAGACMPKMAIHHFCITTPSQIATCLRIKNASEETVGYLAKISSRNREFVGMVE